MSLASPQPFLSHRGATHSPHPLVLVVSGSSIFSELSPKPKIAASGIIIAVVLVLYDIAAEIEMSCAGL